MEATFSRNLINNILIINSGLPIRRKLILFFFFFFQITRQSSRAYNEADELKLNRGTEDHQVCSFEQATKSGSPDTRNRRVVSLAPIQPSDLIFPPERVRARDPSGHATRTGRAGSFALHEAEKFKSRSFMCPHLIRLPSLISRSARNLASNTPRARYARLLLKQPHKR